MVNVKEYLFQIQNIDRQIDNKKSELETLRDLAVTVTSTTNTERVQTSGSSDRLGDTVAKIVDLQDEINSSIHFYVNLKLSIMKTINSLDNAEFVSILQKRYVANKSWSEIAKDMHYTKQCVCKKHGLALLEIQKILEKK